MLQVGEQVKNFTLMNEQGEKVSLNDFTGKRVVIYFYPRDNTPGCTREACSFRDEFDTFIEKDCVLIGISADSQKSHLNFKAKYDLPFVLLSDPDKEVIRDFGAWGEKKLYGKVREGIIRSTFILNRNHQLEFVFNKVKTKDHALAVIEELH